MSPKPLLTALLLLGVMASPAWAEGYTARDIRQPIPVTAKERNQFLFEMRESLHNLFNVHLALSKNDFQAAAIAIRPLGGLLDNTPPRLRERLPEEYVQLAIAMREAIEATARVMTEKKDMAAVQAQLAETMTYCSGCHDTYRFEVRPLSGDGK